MHLLLVVASSGRGEMPSWRDRRQRHVVSGQRSIQQRQERDENDERNQSMV
jgi:hypothetical protein